MKAVKIGLCEIKVCEHQGDISYLRFVKFKQWVPQIWEKMDVPSWKPYFERFKDCYDKGKHASGVMVLHDYELSIRQSKEMSVDAWGICFALIAIEEGEDFRSCPDDSELKSKIERLTTDGLTAKQVKEEVLGFMAASPEEFEDHLRACAVASMLTTTGNLKDLLKSESGQ
jgi:hypothetical protein